MRKFVVCLLLIFITSCSFCFATTETNDEIEPRYIGTFYHSESFTAGSGATLIPKVYLKPKYETSFDKVVIKLRITKVSTGTEYYNRSFTTYYDDVRNWFAVTSSFTAPSRGQYKLKTTYKCYKSGTLIETIEGVTKYATY